MSKDFESTLEKLTAIVETMERGGISLDDALKQFEQGIGLIRSGQELLKTAEQKIEVFNKTKNQLDPFKNVESD